MTDEERRLYAENRIATAFESFKAAELLAENGFWNASVNRLYYACSYIVNALLVVNGTDAKTHSGTKSQFAQLFIKPGLLDREYGKILSNYLTGDNRVTMKAFRDTRRMM